ncbi:MAG: hypothetical protein K2R98_03115 [Gemmataceae bacterium]|nr:hypothetical protein [Gemmataceae bacterium]
MPGQDSRGLTVEELTRLLRAVDSRVYFAPARMLRRAIKQDRQLAGLGIQVPHQRSYWIDRARLLEFVTPGELRLASGDDLPETILLLRDPEPEALVQLPRAEILLKHWRLLFHAHLHRELDQQRAEGTLDEREIRARIQAIGPVEFEEIRTVLRQQGMLLAPEDDCATYLEFVAVYLELRRFATGRPRLYFPGIDELTRIDAIVSTGLDVTALFTSTRPAGAADAPPASRPTPEFTDDAPDAPDGLADTVETRVVQQLGPGQFGRIMRRAEALSQRGNVARAAILKTRAALAVPAHAAQARTEAGAEINRLTRRLQRALHLSSRETKSWRKVLPTLLDPAARGTWPVEARLLYDVQKVCLDHERQVYKLDLIGWVTSLGHRSIQRLLPGQNHVLAVKHLRSAGRRLGAVRMPDAERRELALLIEHGIHMEEERLRERFRPEIQRVIVDVGLQPENLPERVALRKLIEELLDHITERGFLTMGDLRDAISRNQLKLPDLADPGELLLGDRLLRANRSLAVKLDGVYRRGEVYMRWLQRLSSLAFGTNTGRFLTLFAILPFASAFVILMGGEEIVKLTRSLFRGEVLSTGPAVEPLGNEEDGTATLSAMTVKSESAHAGLDLPNPYVFGLLGVFLLLLVNVPAFRRATGHLLLSGYRGLRWMLQEVPAWIARSRIMQQFLHSAIVLATWRYIVKPLIVAGLLSLVFPLAGATANHWMMGAASLFVVMTLVLNTRLGRDLEEVAVDGIVRAWEQFHVEFVPGLFRLIVGFFKRVTESVERVIYTVDEWLRFRSGDSRLSLVIKAVLSVVWLLVTYLVRVFINLFVEPTFNPIKHFPVVTVAAKLIFPTIPTLLKGITAALAPFVGTAVGIFLATAVIFFIPGLAGFLVWELKENWRLYRANRALTLRPVLVGHHGETLRRLLRPGIHSGTIPKLYARLRKAERRARHSGSWRSFRKNYEALHHVEASVRHFVDRELVGLLKESQCWGTDDLRVGAITLATNSIRVQLDCPSLGLEPMRLVFTEQSNWMVAGIAVPGWLPALSEPQRRALGAALAGIYKLAAVELVREQVGAELGELSSHWEIVERGLMVSPPENDAALYDLDEEPVIAPQSGNHKDTHLPTIPSASLRFGNVAITWQDWVELWQRDQEDKQLPDLFPEGVHVLPNGVKAQQAAT